MSYYNIGKSFVWFIARVADIEDPEYLGRVKIRVLHQQTGELGRKMEKFGVNDEDLLWAWPLSAIQSASLNWQKVAEKEDASGVGGLEGFDTPDWIDAVGLSPTGIAVGTYVIGFYLDGHEQNIPMIFGTYHKKSIVPEPPTVAGSKMLQINEPEPNTFDLFSDVAALARGKEGDGGQTLPKNPAKAETLKVTSEPESAYKTQYPYNTTYTTKSGHAIEIDDTPGHERIHIWHKSGSYEEIANGPPQDGEKFEGRRVKKTTDSDYEIVMKDKNILIKQSKNEEIGKDVNIEIGRNGVINIDGRLNMDVKRGIRIDADGGVTITSGSLVVADSIACLSAATGSFTTPTGQVVHVQNGIVTNIV
jgi:hypothetical protein